MFILLFQRSTCIGCGGWLLKIMLTFPMDRCSPEEGEIVTALNKKMHDGGAGWIPTQYIPGPIPTCQHKEKCGRHSAFGSATGAYCTMHARILTGLDPIDSANPIGSIHVSGGEIVWGHAPDGLMIDESTTVGDFKAAFATQEQ